MKRVILFTVAALVALSFSGCASTVDTQTGASQPRKVKKNRVRCDTPVQFPLGQEDFGWYQEQAERQLEECSKNR